MGGEEGESIMSAKNMAVLREKGWKIGAVAAAAACLFAARPITAQAAGGLDLYTDYPGMTAKAGDSLSFSLELDNTGEACDASLSVQSLPDGWEGYISGGGGQISRIHVPSGTAGATATFQLEIPADAAEGSYQVVLAADAGGGVSDTLTLDLAVSELQVSQGDFSSEYPEQEGAAGTAFSFNATLVNNSGETRSYSLSAQSPSGWQVAFRPSGESTQVASIELEPGARQGLTVAVTPPDNVAAGEYTIPCSAISGSETLDMELSVTITEQYQMDLSTPDGLLSFSAQAGADSDVTLSITNNGNVAIENVNLTSSTPSGWNVSFDTPTVDVIEAGGTAQVTAHVTPSDEALTGDYVVTITASTSETSDSAEFRVSVETSMVWGVVAVVILVAIIGVIGWIFRKYGRR